MWLSILAVLIAASTAIVSAVTGDGTKNKKLILSLLAVAGLVIGVYAAIDTEQEKLKEAKKHAIESQALHGQLDSATAALTEIRKGQAEQAPLLNYVTSSVGDLGSLNALSGGYKYFVRLATANNDKGLQDLVATKRRIESEFKGAAASGMVSIVPLSEHTHSMQLIFGRGLSFAAAEVYLRLAISHHLANGQPQIFSESDIPHGILNKG